LKRRTVTGSRCLLTLLAACLLLNAQAFADPVAKPNILADDLGYGDAQCNNPERGKIPTSNIDKLAER